jgi:CheY-like chemotaxis protein
VTDDGPGVPPEDLPRLAERYYRVGAFVKGMGLGLAFCKEILDLHGGELEVLSPPPGRSGGTQVSIRVPLAEAPTAMIIDDSQTIRMLVERQLTRHGYRVRACEDAETALAALRASPPDIVIVDSVMPGMRGVELISRVKSIHALRPIPILMLTGAELDGATRDILEGYMIPVLGKPWKQDELVRCVEDATYGKSYLQG